MDEKGRIARVGCGSDIKEARLCQVGLRYNRGKDLPRLRYKRDKAQI